MGIFVHWKFRYAGGRLTAKEAWRFISFHLLRSSGRVSLRYSARSDGEVLAALLYRICIYNVVLAVWGVPVLSLWLTAVLGNDMWLFLGCYHATGIWALHRTLSGACARSGVCAMVLSWKTMACSRLFSMFMASFALLGRSCIGRLPCLRFPLPVHSPSILTLIWELPPSLTFNPPPSQPILTPYIPLPCYFLLFV